MRHGSSGSLGLAKVHSGEPSGRRIRSSSRGFTGAGIGVVGIILVRQGSLGWAKESSGFAWVHSGALSSQSGSRGFTRLRLGNFEFIRVHIGSLRRAQKSAGSFQVHWSVPRGGPVHLVSRRFTRALLGVVRFLRDRVGLLGRI